MEGNLYVSNDDFLYILLRDNDAKIYYYSNDNDMKSIIPLELFDESIKHTIQNYNNYENHSVIFKSLPDATDTITGSYAFEKAELYVTQSDNTINIKGFASFGENIGEFTFESDLVNNSTVIYKEEYFNNDQYVAFYFSDSNVSVIDNLNTWGLNVTFTGNYARYIRDYGGIEKDESIQDDDYILPYSSTRVLSYDELDGLTSTELRIARNEIYARYGRQFQNQDLQDYFNTKSWYISIPKLQNEVEPLISSIEKKNIDIIMDCESNTINGIYVYFGN